ncbi:DUF427 domain-containing protein [Phycicoccus flavus]|uniref:DUF427 domain-containing protein n=1 Tax=Phycicoccus flavus TaxID=2502783 RepID=A0A8T6R8T9_9MICO|nr:DUF427 domain-containing protein [Phycicoccus flavus]NHA70142.1 DUF427 domain-containing protein [Phycicoccus flavus]
MALTTPPGPLSRRTGDTNYTVDGPAHRILLTPTDKRVRVLVGDGAGGRRTVVDTTRALLLHETGLLPRYYVPVEDVDADLLLDSDTSTHCPFKGDATYAHVRAGERTAPDLVWFYRDPVATMPALAGLAGLYLEHLDLLPADARPDGEGAEPLDVVLEEEQPVLGHPRDPYHRVDAWPSSRHVVVTWEPQGRDPVVLAETSHPVGLFETGFPARWYVPADDVRDDLLESSPTRTVCPYKGVADHRSVAGGPADVAWRYRDPLPEASAVAGLTCFLGDDVVTTVDGERLTA